MDGHADPVHAARRLKIKAPANVAFKVGILDTYTNHGWVTFPANTAASGWVDVHDSVNGGDLQNVRMRQDGSTSRYTAGGLKAGDVVGYRFTSWDTARQVATDSAASRIVMK